MQAKPGEKVGKFTEFKETASSHLLHKKRDFEEGEIDENKGKEYLSLAAGSS